MYFKPSYLPHNGAANILVKSLAEELGLSLNKKYEIILASFLAIAKKVNGQAFDWWIDNNNKNRNIWSLFPHVNNQSVRETYNLLKAHQYIETSTDFPNYLAERIGFGRPNWIKAKRLTKNFLEMATFVEANLPYVLVNKPETYEEKVVRKNLNLSAPTLSNAEVKQRFGREYIQAYKPLKEMND